MMRARVLIPFIVATLIWGSTWIVIRGQLGVVPPTWSVTYRFATGALAMFIWAIFTRTPLRLDPQARMFVLIFGVLQFVFNFNFVYRAEGYITSGLVAVLFALLLVPNAVLGRLFLKQPLSAQFLAGSAIAMLGVGMLILREVRADTAGMRETVLGAAFTIAGVLSASAANIMQGTAQGRALPMTAVLAWGMLVGSAINAALAWVTVGPPVVAWTLSYIGGVVYLGIMASAVAFTCYFSVIRSVGPARAAYSGVVVPIIAMALSTLFEHYRWTPLAVAGGVVAMIGLVVALSAKRVSRSG